MASTTPATIGSRYRALKAEPGLLARSELADLCRRRPLRALLAIAGEWLGIGLAIALYVQLDAPALYPLLVVWIGARMLGLWVLAHEGLHQLLLPDARVNDRLTRLLLAWPIFESLSEFRRVHLRHHAHLHTPDDPESELVAHPEFRFPSSAGRLAGIALLDLSGINFVRFRLRKLAPRARAALTTLRAGDLPRPNVDPAKLAYYTVAAVLVTALGAWRELLLFWLVPYATWFQLVLRLRLMVEHRHLPEADHLQTRTVAPLWLERWLFTPHHVSFHVEHHLYPAVPCYNLPRLHRRVREADRLARLSPVRRGYLRTLAEFCQPGS